VVVEKKKKKKKKVLTENKPTSVVVAVTGLSHYQQVSSFLLADFAFGVVPSSPFRN
jgi:hypothetical protein